MNGYRVINDMEQWQRKNNMIRVIGEKEDPNEYLAVSTERLRILENQLSTHIKWFTHKNPYGCSICDLLNLTEVIIQTFELFLGPGQSQVTEEIGGLDTQASTEENESNK